MAVSTHIVFTLVFISLMSFTELVAISGETNTYVKLPLGKNQTGPETVAFDCKGEGPYVGISDGRILKWQGPYIGWTTYAITAQLREGLQVINNGDQSGRLMKYDMGTREVTVLLRKLYFANGVALSKDNDFVLVAQTTTGQIIKYWLSGYKAGCHEVLLQLNGRPSNINRDANGDFCIAMRMAKSIKINHLGKILETLDGDEIVNPRDVCEFDHRLWIGFVDQPYIYHT